MKRKLTYHYLRFASLYGKKAFEAVGRNKFFMAKYFIGT